MVDVAYGEESPTAGETPVSWQTWSDGAAGIPLVEGDQDWGKLALPLTGAEGRSAVRDMGSSMTRIYTLTENLYGTGSGSARLEIRGDTTSFLQDDTAPVWEAYSAPISRNWRYVQIRESTNVRLAMWVWAANLKSKANCDAMIAFATGRMTDLFVFAIDDSVTPRTWLGSGTLGDSNATDIEASHTPLAYIIDHAHAVGIKVHAWLWMGYFPYWGGANGLMTPDCPDNATYNDANVWNYNNSTARTLLSDTIADFVTSNPGLDGLHFDFEATTANITAQNMTDFLTELYAAVVDADLEFSCCTGASISDDVALKISMDAWLNAGLIQTPVLMGYYDCDGIKRQYVDSLTVSSRQVIAGLGCEATIEQPSDFRYKWLLELADGFTSFAIFCWGDNIVNDTDLQDAIDLYLASTLTTGTVQNPITKVSMNPGTSWTITVNGVDQTTAYADVTGHTTAGALKAHVEAAIGSENPAIWYRREASATTYICIGDWEP
jgi:hypothetical protein